MQFRVWNKRHRRYIDFEDLVLDMSGRLLDRDRYVLGFREHTVERGTGLRDCLETPIFEGDILRVTEPDGTEIVATVAWVDGAFRTEHTRGDDTIRWLFNNVSPLGLRVIGTVHNKE